MNNMESLNCQNCGSPMEYVPGMPVVTCSHCGSKWQTQAYSIFTPVQGPDGVIFQAWIPEGWGYSAERDEKWVSTQEIVTFDLLASSSTASLWFYPKAYFRDGNSRSYGLNPLTFQNSHKYLPLEEYVPSRLQESFPGAVLKKVSFVSTEPFAAIARQFLPEAARHVKEPVSEAGVFQFEMEMNGQTFYGLFGTVLVHKNTVQKEERIQTVPPVPPMPKPKAKMNLDFFMRGGLIGAKMRGEEVPLFGDSRLLQQGKELLESTGIHAPSMMRGLWARGMDVILLTSDSRLHLYQDIFTCFASNVHYGPGYTAAQQREMEQVNQICIQGAMQRQQNQINASQRLSNTISQQNNMIMDTWNKKQAAQTRMSNNYSEAIRGVNSYTTTYGEKVEASVRYDHVYQNGSDFVASDANLNLGPDWTELKKNK